MSRWIPVSERLPEKTGKYIVTAFDGVKSRSTYAHFQKTVGNFILTGRRSAWRVTAWIPMPEPYNEGILNTADDEAQTTDAEPVKHAYWEEKQDMNGDTYYHCTNCKEDFALLEGTPKDNLYYYCPYCGAKMDLKEGESE